MDILGDLLGNVQIGLSSAVTPTNLFYCFVGVFLGMVVGVLPGIGTLATMSMLFPLTFYLEPTTGLIMLAGLFYGSAYGGSTASILLNVPGTPSSAVVCLDGYPMAKQGRAGVALFMATIGSFFAGSVGIILMMVASPLIVSVALQFSSAEYFALMALGLIAATAVSEGSAVKGIAMVCMGLFLGSVGLDLYSGMPRYTFGLIQLSDGISLVAVAMGVFGLSELIVSIRAVKPGEVQHVTLRSMIPTREDWRRSIGAMLRGTGIGAFFGILPGVGPTVSAFMSYAVERKISKNPGEFGNGAIEGVVAPESANNASDQTAFIPTLTLGIPGSAMMALLLGVLIMHGITPGPSLMAERPDMFWGLVMSFWIGNLILLILNIPLISLWVSILRVPYKFLFPAISMFICIGVYSINNSPFDVVLVVAFGLFGYVARILGFSLAPLILGFVLGPLMEEHFQRAMIQSRGNVAILFERPISGTIMVIVVALVAWAVWGAFKRRRQTASA